MFLIRRRRAPQIRVVICQLPPQIVHVPVPWPYPVLASWPLPQPLTIIEGQSVTR